MKKILYERIVRVCLVVLLLCVTAVVLPASATTEAAHTTTEAANTTTIQSISPYAVPAISVVGNMYTDRYTLYLFPSHEEYLVNVNTVLLNGSPVSKFTVTNHYLRSQDTVIRINLNPNHFVGDEIISLQWGNSTTNTFSGIVYHNLAKNQVTITSYRSGDYSYPGRVIECDTGIDPITKGQTLIRDITIGPKGQPYNFITIEINQPYLYYPMYFFWEPTNGTYQIIAHDTLGRSSAPYEVVVDWPVAEIESITPSFISNEREEESLVTIKGKHFTSNSTAPLIVHFGDHLDITKFESRSETELSFYAPRITSTATYNVTITNASGEISSMHPVRYEEPKLGIISYFPPKVDREGGVPVTVYGKHFETIKKVLLNNIDITSSCDITEASLSFEMPAFPTYPFGNVPIILENDLGSVPGAIPLLDTTGPPTFTGITKYPLPGAPVTITGTNLHRISRIFQNMIQGITIPFQVVSSTEIICWPTGGYGTGAYLTGIYNLYDPVGPIYLHFSGPPAALITTVTPQTVISNEVITVKGRNFNNLSQVAHVVLIPEGDPRVDWPYSFGPNSTVLSLDEGEFELVDDETIRFRMPARMEKGKYNLCLSRYLVSSTSQSNEVLLTKLTCSPVIDSLSFPTIAIGTGTTEITLHSEDLKDLLKYDFSVELSMSDGVVLCPDIDLAVPAGTTPTKLWFDVPNQSSPSEVEVRLVRYRDGIAEKSEPAIIQFVALDPVLSSLSYETLGNGTKSVLITGQYLVDVKKVEVGGVEVKDFTAINSTQLRFTPPPAAAGSKVNVVVTTAVGGSNALSLVYPLVNIPVANVKITGNPAKLDLNKTVKLKAVISPTNATNQKVTWSSSNTVVATVSSTGVVTAKKSGTAKITVKTVDGGRTSTCAITVNIPVTGVKITGNPAKLNLNKTVKLNAVISPTNASNKKVTWSSSNTKVATVTSTGQVKGISAGTVTITATADGKRASVKITVDIYVSMRIGKRTAVNNGAKATIDKDNAYPFKTGGRTMLPIRFIGEKMGGKVTYTSEKKPIVVTYGGKRVELTLGSKIMTVTENKKTREITLDVAAMKRDGRTYLPIRAVSEALGFTVYYQAGTEYIVINSSKMSVSQRNVRLAEAKKMIQ